MPLDSNFVSATDKAALLAASTPEVLEMCKQTLSELTYKVHCPPSHDLFAARFGQLQYHLVLLEQLFCARIPAENASLLRLQTLPMTQRRHAVVLLVGESFESLNPMQAFQQSVHAVINRRDLTSLPQIIVKAVADTDAFLNLYRNVQLKLIHGKS